MANTFFTPTSKIKPTIEGKQASLKNAQEHLQEMENVENLIATCLRDIAKIVKSAAQVADAKAQEAHDSDVGVVRPDERFSTSELGSKFSQARAQLQTMCNHQAAAISKEQGEQAGPTAAPDFSK